MRLTSNTIDIFGCICIIAATCYIYRKARKTNRKAGRWALSTFAVGFGFQIIIPLVIVLSFTLIMVILKRPWSEAQKVIEKYGLMSSIIFLNFNLIGSWLIIRRVSKISEGKTVAPLPPPTFDGK